MIGLPPKSIDRPSPEPVALPTEKLRQIRKTPTPAIRPIGLPSSSLIELISETGDLIPSRTLMSERKIIRIVDSTTTQIRT